MGVGSTQSSRTALALKGRLIRDSYIDAKRVITRPKVVKLLDQAEDLIPTSFGVIDESVSSGYLRLTQRDPDQNVIYLLIMVIMSIQFSCLQAILKSAFSVAGMQPSTAEGESYVHSIRDRVIAVYRYLTNRVRAMVDLVVDTAKTMHEMLDHDGDGHIGTNDALQCSYRALCHLARFTMMLASIVYYYVLVVIRKLVDIVLPPPPSPVKPEAQLHQNSPKRIAEEKLERFERPEEQPITIIGILEIVYDRLLIRAGPWVQRIASWSTIAYQSLHQSVRWCHDQFQAMFRQADVPADTSPSS